jgi:hypothetical protein
MLAREIPLKPWNEEEFLRPFPSVMFVFNKLFLLQMARALIENFIHLAENSVTVYDAGEDGR